jgi:SPOR domain
MLSNMHRCPPSWWIAVLGAVAVSVAVPAVRAQQATDDSTLARVQQLVNAGDRQTARRLADSVLSVNSPGSPAYAEALYARAFATSSAADAERDYLRVSIEYPLSPRAEDALLMVAQLRLARNDRTGARRQFERLTRDYPSGALAGRAAFWAGRLALEDGDMAAGCPSIVLARQRVPAGDVELGNQIDYYVARCAGFNAARAMDSVRSDSALPGGNRPSAADSSQPVRATAPANQTQYSVQVAAFARERDATVLARRLRDRGFGVRVYGSKAPFRVRVGRYATREEATAAMERMRRSNVRGIVVEAEPR